MFTWLNKQGVRSDSGFELQFTGRFDAEYREGGRVVELYVEAGITNGEPSIIVDPDAFMRWKDGAPIDEAKQEVMFRNLRDALAFQGLRLSIERPMNE